MSASRGRTLVANFAAEIEMARGMSPGPHPDLPAAVTRRLEAAATSLAALDPRATIAAGVGSLEDTGAILAWAETDSVAAARRRLDAEPAGPLPGGRDLGDGRWLEGLWSLIPSPAIAARCHHRGFWLELAAARGWLLAETHRVASLAELRSRLPAIGARAVGGGWSVVAPLSAAGRERVHRWGPEISGDIATRIERLIARFGWVLAAPWHRRELDFGLVGVVTASEPLLFRPHRQEVDGSGVFRSVAIDEDTGGWLTAEDHRAILEAADAAGRALDAAGYRGPFGIDGFVYRDAAGERRLHRMCEMNARMSFGLVARAAWERAGRPARFCWAP